MTIWLNNTNNVFLINIELDSIKKHKSPLDELEDRSKEMNRKYTDEKVNWYVDTDGKDAPQV